MRSEWSAPIRQTLFEEASFKIRVDGIGSHDWHLFPREWQVVRKTTVGGSGIPVHGVVVSAGTQKGPRTWSKCGGRFYISGVIGNPAGHLLCARDHFVRRYSQSN